MELLKTELTNVSRENLAPYRFHYPRLCACKLDTIDELIFILKIEKIGEDDTQPGGKWEQYLAQKQQRRQAGMSESSCSDSSDDDFSASPTSSSPTLTDQNKQKHIAAVFTGFPADLIESRRLGAIDDDEYGIMSISQDGAWMHLGYDDLPQDIRLWMASFTRGFLSRPIADKMLRHCSACLPSFGIATDLVCVSTVGHATMPSAYVAMADSHTWLFATPATEFVCNTISFDVWYRAIMPSEPSTEQS